MSENSAPQTRPVLQLVAIDCPDAAALAAFYAGILGWRVEADDDDDWVSIFPPGAQEGTVHVAFQQVDDYVAPTWPGGDHPQQFHLDLAVADLAHGEAQVLAAGATRHEHQPATDGSFVVYLDPAGHPFCLVS